MADYAIKAERVHTMNQLLKAYTMFNKDDEYVVIDGEVARALSEKQEGKTVVLDEALTKENYAIALKKGNDELTAKIDEAIDAIIADGTLYTIFDNYGLTYDVE